MREQFKRQDPDVKSFLNEILKRNFFESGLFARKGNFFWYESSCFWRWRSVLMLIGHIHDYTRLHYESTCNGV